MQCKAKIGMVPVISHLAPHHPISFSDGYPIGSSQRAPDKKMVQWARSSIFCESQEKKDYQIRLALVHIEIFLSSRLVKFYHSVNNWLQSYATIRRLFTITFIWRTNTVLLFTLADKPSLSLVAPCCITGKG